MNEKVLTKIKDLFQNSKKSVIVEGYPKTLEQAVNLQRAQIPPTKVIFMNVNDMHLRQICEYKITSNHSDLSRE
jgi:adenylate kinase family enzyme